MAAKSLNPTKEFYLSDEFIFVAISESDVSYLGRLEKDGKVVGQASFIKPLFAAEKANKATK